MPQTGPLSAPDDEIECLVERSALSSSNKRTQAPMEPIDDGAMSPVSISVRKPLNRTPLGDAEMSDPPRIERPYQIDDQWSRAVFLRRTGQVASFLAPHLRAGMRLIDCGCGPGSITIDLARIVAPGGVVGIDRRQTSL